MITQLRVDLTDDQRKALRLALGFRGGMASRKEVLAWAHRLLADALNKAPEVRQRPVPPEALVIAGGGVGGPVDYGPVEEIKERGSLIDRQPERTASHARVAKQRLFELATDAPDDAVCRNCGKPKERHGLMGFSCPAGTGSYGIFEEVPK